MSILNENIDLEKETKKYINLEKEVNSELDALKGAKDIIAEIVSEDAKLRKYIRDLSLREGTITQQEFESAHIIAKNIIKGIKFDKSRLDEFCYSKLNQFINRTREDIDDE